MTELYIVSDAQLEKTWGKTRLQLAEVLPGLYAGLMYRRLGWPDSIRFIAVYDSSQFDNSHDKMTEAYLYCVSGDNRLMPYALSNEDVFAHDWVRV